MIKAPFTGARKKEDTSKQCKQKRILIFVPDFPAPDKKRNVNKRTYNYYTSYPGE